MIENLLFGLLNGITAWPLLLLHIFGIFAQYSVYNLSVAKSSSSALGKAASSAYDVSRNTGWYQFGFLIGAASPLLGFLGKH